MQHRGKRSKQGARVSKRLLMPFMLSGIAFSGAAWSEEQATQTDALDLPAQTITGKQDDETLVTVGSKTPVKLREIPQTVNVVGQERIEEQNLYTLEQAMKQVGGVTVQRIDANRVTYFSRGFEMTSLSLDGTPTTMDNRIFLSPSLAMYERVEVLKGPAGILNGTGGTGGSINLVRKRPQAEAAVSGELSAGSWDDYRGMIDVTGPLTESGNIRGRVVASKRDRHFYYDGGDEKSNLFYGVLEADLTPDTLLTFGVSHQEVDARGAQRSLPSYLSGTPGDFKLSLVKPSRYNFYGADWNREYFWSDSAFAELEQQLADGWKAKLSLRHTQNNFDLTQAYARNGFFGSGLDNIYPGINPATNLVDMHALRFDYREEQNEVDAYVDGPFSLFGREHKLLVGANYSRSEFFDKGDFIADSLGAVNLFDPQLDAAQPDLDPQQNISVDTRQRGIYSNLRLSLADPLTLVLGGRMSWWDATRNVTDNVDGDPDQRVKDKVTREFTPFAGLVYDLNDTYSLYASYAEIFQPHDARVRKIDGGMLAPLEGKQWETGIKGEYLDSSLMASLALFHIEEENRETPDLDDSNASIASGKVRSRGFEAELNGQLAADWTLNANYTYTQKVYHSEESTELYTPKHMLRVWTHYQLPGEWERWSVQGGMNTVSNTYTRTNHPNPAAGFDDTKLEQGGYTLFDAGVGYQITPQLSADLLVTNLTDKKYYQRINNPYDGNIWGDPRAATMTLRAKF